MSLAIVNALNGMAQVFYFLNEDSQPTIFCTHWIVLVFQDVWAGFGVIISTSSFKSRIQTSQCPVHPPPHTIQHTSLWDGLSQPDRTLFNPGSLGAIHPPLLMLLNFLEFGFYPIAICSIVCDAQYHESTAKILGHVFGARLGFN
jgi:hypothetical protein